MPSMNFLRGSELDVEIREIFLKWIFYSVILESYGFLYFSSNNKLHYSVLSVYLDALSKWATKQKLYEKYSKWNIINLIFTECKCQVEIMYGFIFQKSNTGWL